MKITKKFGNWLISGINAAHTITQERGNLRQTVRALKEKGYYGRSKQEDLAVRRNYIESYNRKAIFREFSSISDIGAWPSQKNFRKPTKDYELLLTP